MPCRTKNIMVETHDIFVFRRVEQLLVRGFYGARIDCVGFLFIHLTRRHNLQIFEKASFDKQVSASSFPQSTGASTSTGIPRLLMSWCSGVSYLAMVTATPPSPPLQLVDRLHDALPERSFPRHGGASVFLQRRCHDLGGRRRVPVHEQH